MTARAGRWLGVPARIALANAGSIFGSAVPPGLGRTSTPVGHSALSRRAGAVLRGPGIVVAYEGGSPAPGQSVHTAVRVPWRSGDLCVDLADNGSAIDELRRACADFPAPWALWAQVFSPAADTMTLDLSRRGFDRSVLPRCSGVTVGYWNTKVGGGELLKRVLPDAVPTTTCSSPAEVQECVARSSAAQSVVKPDHGLAGHGVVRVDASLSVEQIADLLTRPEASSDRAKKDGGKSPVPGNPARYIVQPVVGNPATNVSPTADFWVEPNGNVRAVGYADQLLDDSVRYVGSQTSIAGSEVRRHIGDAGLKVGRELYKNGYVGLFNLDAVYSADGVIAIVEVNVRQSAPLDQSLTMTRVYGSPSQEEFTYAFRAHEPGHVAGTANLLGGELHVYGASDDDNGLSMAVARRIASGR